MNSGACMARGGTGSTGATNHRGELFTGLGEETHPGLIVTDGAAIPTSLGANPLATILSAAMMLRYTFALEEPARRIEQAVQSVLATGPRTGDIWREGKVLTGTQVMGDAVLAALAAQK